MPKGKGYGHGPATSSSKGSTESGHGPAMSGGASKPKEHAGIRCDKDYKRTGYHKAASGTVKSG